MVLVAAATFGVAELLAPRAVYLQVGAMLGTIMAGNVFLVIIPAHRELIRAKREGRDPDPAWNARAKQRSVHNNYLTLPVVFTMLADHFPLTYGADDAWLVLVAIMLLSAWLRLFFNLRHQGRTVWAIPASGAVGLAIVAVWLAPEGGDSAGPPPPAVAAEGKTLFVSAGCGSCHTLADAGATGAVGPSLDAAQPSRELVVERVTNGQGAMPSFRGQLSPAQIDALADYVSTAADR